MTASSKGQKMGSMVESIARPRNRPGRRGPAERARIARKRRMTGMCAALLAVLSLSGCGQFFSKVKTTSTGTGTGSTTGDYLYIANSNPSLNTVAGFSLSSGALTATASSPYQLAIEPSAMAITPANTFLYVGSVLGGIYGYTIGSTGGLTQIGTSVVSTAGASVMTVDSTGQWLLVLQLGTTNPSLSAFPINTSTGALSNATSTVTLDSGTPNSMVLVPSSTLLYVSLGAPSTTTLGGVDALTFDSTTGTLTKLNVHLNATATAYSDNGLATDTLGKYLFVAETGINGIRGFTINTDGTLSTLAGSPTSAGAGPGALLVDSTGAFLYAANKVDGTISAFTLSSAGALTEISGSPFTTGLSPLSMVEDSSKSYVAVICSAGSPDLQLFSITALTGALVSVATQSTGSVSPAEADAIAASY